ncbi:MAG: hypothetical protein LBM93_14905 [Oscillospiraceae bacterium]|jgi:hypothetical protein|nr:hypothetical protein [Oscillospiraceae bacterium]
MEININEKYLDYVKKQNLDINEVVNDSLCSFLNIDNEFEDLSDDAIAYILKAEKNLGNPDYWISEKDMLAEIDEIIIGQKKYAI